MRLSRYSPIDVVENENTYKNSWSADSNSLNSYLNIVKLSELNQQSNKHILRLIHLFTQLFVFSIVQKLISENNFGRNNPLRQKDQKTNQARILWPKNQLVFWLDKNRNTNKLPDLPGIQELAPLIQVLIESLQKKNTKGGSPPTGYKTQFGGRTTISFAPKGYLFVGPPGTGKTLLAQEIAQIAKVPFICVSASEIQKQIEIGTRIGALRLRKLFEQARSLSPCILFFDEIDAIAQRQQSQHDSKLFTEFLIQMDSWGPTKTENQSCRKMAHSVLLGTTNYLSKLDSAFVRSGRFDRILALDYPSKKIRFDILKFYVTKTNSADQKLQNEVLRPAGPAGSGGSTLDIFLGSVLGLNYFAYLTAGFSQAHLARMVNESLLFAISLQEKQKDKKQGPTSLKTSFLDGGESPRVIERSKVLSGDTAADGPRHSDSNTMVSSNALRSSLPVKPLKSCLHSFESLLHGFEKMKLHRVLLKQKNNSID